ncbi:MAG: DUF4388 domain-containing protein [Deferribacterales bacterium]
MALEGKLKEFGLIDIIQMISQTGKTGILKVFSENSNADIYFVKGSILEVKSNIEIGLRLGNFLVSKGIITEDELEQYLEIQKKTPIRLGKLLIKSGKISPDDIKKFNVEQIKEYLSKVLMFRDGGYRFDTVFIDYDPEEIEPVTVDTILLDVLKEIDEVNYISKKIDSFNYIFIKGGKGVMVNQEVSNEEPVIDKSNIVIISKDAFTIYTLIDGKNSVEHIIKKTGFSSNFVLKVVYNLNNFGCIQIYKAPKTKKTLWEIIKVKEMVLAAFFIGLVIILSILIYKLGNVITSSPFTTEYSSYSEIFKKDYEAYNRQKDYFLNNIEK